MYGLSNVSCFQVDGKRIEFSTHPELSGYLHQNVVIWEEEDYSYKEDVANIFWPNDFSKLIGDKAYGLLIAHLHGFNVPHTQVFVRSRKIKPFSFGCERQADNLVFTRTCPAVPVHGKFSTVDYYHDPYDLMEQDDPEGNTVVSCLMQDAINATYSGKCIGQGAESDSPIVEGVRGFGMSYMEGKQNPDTLDKAVVSRIGDVYRQIKYNLKYRLSPDVSFEFVLDQRNRGFIVQLQLTSNLFNTVSGEINLKDIDRPLLEFNATSQSLDDLRNLVSTAEKEDKGIRVLGNVGLTSHIADILRNSRVPIFIIRDVIFKNRGSIC